MARIQIEFIDRDSMINNLAYIQTFINVIEVSSTIVSITGIIKDSIVESSILSLNALIGIKNIKQI